MGDSRLTIDTATLFDNPTDHQVEFAGSIDGESYRFAVRYAIIEALGATPPLERPAGLVEAHRDAILRAAMVALGRADAQDPIVVTEADLEQTADGKAGPEADGFAPRDAGAEPEAHPS